MEDTIRGKDISAMKYAKRGLCDVSVPDFTVYT